MADGGSWPPPGVPQLRPDGARATWWRRKFWKAPVWAWALVVLALVAAGAAGVGDDDEDSRLAVGGAVSLPTSAAERRRDPATATTSTVPTSTTTTSTVPTSTVPTSTVPTSTTTTSTVPTTSVPGSLLALDVLATIPVGNEQRAEYDRESFGYPEDHDGDGCDTRAEVLIRDALGAAQVDPSGCQVVAGDWFSAYDGVTWSDPAEVQIDHVVALEEAWDSGAWAWDDERRVAFGNDLEDARSLRVVTADVNHAKADADPSNWLPPDPAFVCAYLADWVAIKARWGLSMDQSEFGRIRNVLTDRCPGQSIAPWPATPPPSPSSSPPPPPTPPLPSPTTVPPATVAAPPPAAQQPPAENCHPSYPTVCIPAPPPDLDCGDIPYTRFDVVGPDPHRFDGDKDGIGCES